MRTCSIDGCNSLSWSKGLCKYHSPKSPLKSNKPESNKSYLENRNRFFMEVWNERSHKCEHCDSVLGSEPLSYMFDHILEKEKYKDLEFEKDNIWLVCLECHDNKSRGILSDKYQQKINFVKSKFDKS